MYAKHLCNAANHKGQPMKVVDININDPQRISALLFGINAPIFYRVVTFEEFKNIIKDEMVVFNWDNYPIEYVNKHELIGFLDYLEAQGADDIVYVGRFDTNMISEKDFYSRYYPGYNFTIET